MRLRNVLVVVFCLVAASGRGATRYGIKVGACFAERTYSYLSYAEAPVPVGVTLSHAREGMSVGVFGHWSGSSQLGLMVEAQHIQKGIGGLDGEHVDCICFPLLPRYDAHFGRSRLYAALGPRLDMYLGPDEPYSYLDSTDVGVDAVLGYQLGRVSVETRYSGTRERDPPPGGIRSSGDVYQVLLGWTFWCDGQPHDGGASEPPN